MNSARSPLGEPKASGSRARRPPRRSSNVRSSIEKSRSATQSPSSSSSTIRRTSSMPTLSTSTFRRARARLTRSQSWWSKMRKTASAHLRYSPSSAVHELVQRRRDARHDRRAAADADLEALHAVALAGDEGDVVDAGQRAVGVGAGEGGLDLARHQLRRGVAHEVAHVGADVGRRVEQLVVADAGPRVGGHVAHRVAAALAAGEPGSRRSRGSGPPCRAAGCGGSGCSGAS